MLNRPNTSQSLFEEMQELIPTIPLNDENIEQVDQLLISRESLNSIIREDYNFTFEEIHTKKLDLFSEGQSE